MYDEVNDKDETLRLREKVAELEARIQTAEEALRPLLKSARSLALATEGFIESISEYLGEDLARACVYAKTEEVDKLMPAFSAKTRELDENVLAGYEAKRIQYEDSVKSAVDDTIKSIMNLERIAPELFKE